MSLSLGFFVMPAGTGRRENVIILAVALILAMTVPLHADGEGTIRLLSYSSDGLIFEYLSGEVVVEELSGRSEGEIFEVLHLQDCDLTTDAGSPMVPIRSVSIGLPPQGEVFFSILEDEFQELSGVNLAPGPLVYSGGSEGSSFYETVYRPDERIYKEDTFYPPEICTAQMAMHMRHQRVLPLIISPVQFNPVTRTARIHRRIVVQVTFSPASPGLQQEARSDLFENVYNSALLNGQQARGWRWRVPAVPRGLPGGEDPFSTADDWFKISTRMAGIYRLTGSDLNRVGLDLAAVDAATIKIYNIGLKILPSQIGNAPIMSQIPILVSGQEDGRLDLEDEILFYATDLSGWEEMSQGGYGEYANPYTELNVYWLTYGGEPGSRMVSRSGDPQSSAFVQADQFRTTAHRENEFLNPGYSGLTWYWDSMTGHSYETAEHQLVLAGVKAETCRLKVSIKGISYSPSNTVPSSIPHHVYFYWNEDPDPVIERFWYDAVAIVAEGEARGLRDGVNTLKVVLPRIESEWDHILFDWFEIEYWRGYQVVDDQFHFSSPEAAGVLQYDLQGFSREGVRLLDVSDPYGPVEIVGGSMFSEGDRYTLRFQDPLSQGEIKRYFVAAPDVYNLAYSIERRIPADLRQVSADVIMVTPQVFRERLEPLANLHEQEGLRVTVANIEDIYDQFAWGLKDPTAIRDFLKLAYDQGQAPVPAYVLLFGDGNFDYKNNSGAGAGNWMPPFENGDICTDDWFVRLDGDKLADMMIGRLPVQSGEEASVVVDKIVDYMRSPVFGPWRNRVMIVSDDETGSGGTGNELFHTHDSENLAWRFVPASFDQRKVYLMEYPMDWSNKKPQAQQAVVDGFNEGMLWINWIGHGNFDVWAHEDAFRGSNDIPKLNNEKRLPLVYSASCDVGRFDHTLNESMAEELLRAESRGAVATIAATRYCYATPNAELNKEVIKRILGDEDLTLGEGLFAAKLSRPNSYSNDQKYALFGDPCMHLGKPQLGSRIVHMSSDTLRAQDLMNIQGQVYVDDAADTVFSGKVSVQVFDSHRPTTYTTQAGSRVSYTLPGASIFRGSSLFEKGRFQAAFVVPKDISYGRQSARISAYLNDGLRDGLAYRDSLAVQGTATAVADTQGPAIELGIAGQEFASGDFASSSPTIIAHLEDENGINITGEVGHWIVLDVDENAQRINVTDRFEYDSGSYQRGMLQCTLERLRTGQHSVTLKAWDNFNNFSTETLSFEVAQDERLDLRNVLNCPNPFDPRSEDTRFTFELSQPAQVTIKIYTVGGRLIRTIEEGDQMQGYNESRPWNGEDQDGDRVANGVYLYKIIARAQEKRTQAYGKVVVMR